MTTAESSSHTRRVWLFLGLLWLAVFAIRLIGPPNILDQDQQRPASYVLDVVQNGHWICQRDYVNDITSKPPLWTCSSALVTLVCGQVSLFSIYLPGAAAMAGTMALLFLAGRKYFSLPAGVYAAITLILCSAGSKWMGLARTDGLFTFTITAAALLAWRAWNGQSSWTAFWLMGAIVTLTKGPLGVVLAATGLLAVLWERKQSDRPRLKGSHWLGILLFFLIAGGWFALAYRQEGHDLVNKMLGKELVGHIAHDAKGRLPGRLLWQPPLWYISNAAPWSLLAFFGLFRIWKSPAQNPDERRFERFLFCWFLADLVLFSVSPHQRADLLWPIMPPGALLAGRELSRLLSRFSPQKVLAGTLMITLIGVAGIGFFFFHLRGQEKLVKQTVALKKLAAQWKNATRDHPLKLVNMDAPMAFQFYLNILRPQVPANDIAEILRGPDPVFVAVKDIDDLATARRPDDPPCYAVLPVPDEQNLSPLRIISNYPNFGVTNRFVFTSESAK